MDNLTADNKVHLYNDLINRPNFVGKNQDNAEKLGLVLTIN